MKTATERGEQMSINKLSIAASLLLVALSTVACSMNQTQTVRDPAAAPNGEVGTVVVDETRLSTQVSRSGVRVNTLEGATLNDVALVSGGNIELAHFQNVHGLAIADPMSNLVALVVRDLADTAPDSQESLEERDIDTELFKDTLVVVDTESGNVVERLPIEADLIVTGVAKNSVGMTGTYGGAWIWTQSKPGQIEQVDAKRFLLDLTEDVRLLTDFDTGAVLTDSSGKVRMEFPGLEFGQLNALASRILGVTLDDQLVQIDVASGEPTKLAYDARDVALEWGPSDTILLREGLATPGREFQVAACDELVAQPCSSKSQELTLVVGALPNNFQGQRAAQ